MGKDRREELVKIKMEIRIGEIMEIKMCEMAMELQRRWQNDKKLQLKTKVFSLEDHKYHFVIGHVPDDIVKDGAVKCQLGGNIRARPVNLVWIMNSDELVEHWYERMGLDMLDEGIFTYLKAFHEWVDKYPFPEQYPPTNYATVHLQFVMYDCYHKRWEVTAPGSGSFDGRWELM